MGGCGIARGMDYSGLRELVLEVFKEGKRATFHGVMPARNSMRSKGGEGQTGILPQYRETEA